MRVSRLGAACCAAIAMVGLTTRVAEAVPFTINSVLTGDFRTNNPDNILINVTIQGDTTSNLTTWVVDLNSPTAHPNMNLHAFAFNVLGGGFNDFTFSAITPGGWSFSLGNNVPGSGSADFLIEANDPSGPGNNVTNSVPLTFTLAYDLGNWSEAMFYNAPLSTGGGIPAPGAQMGAHVRSLSTNGCSGCSDSGFASGNYDRPPTTSVPEPSSLLLMGIGLGGVLFRQRRKRS
jgi:hypothetical protein